MDGPYNILPVMFKVSLAARAIKKELGFGSVLEVLIILVSG
jgi:hypothetical protein